MTEVIRVTRDPKAGEAVAGEPAQTGPETHHTIEVIKVGKGPGAGEAVAPEAGQTDSERPQTEEVIRVGKTPGAAEAVPINPASHIDLPHDVAAVGAAFADSLKALDAIAAEQARLLVELAICLAEAARSPEPAEYGPNPMAGDDSGDQIERLVTGLKQAAGIQMKAFEAAQARLAEMAAGRNSDSQPTHGSVSPAHPYTPVSTALANIVSNLNLAQQNAVANQQAMNSIAQAAIAGGLSLLYSLTARPAGGQKE